MPDIEDYPVVRGVERTVKGQGQLDDTEVRGKVPAGAADIFDKVAAYLGGEGVKLGVGKAPEVGGGAYSVQYLVFSRKKNLPSRIS